MGTLAKNRLINAKTRMNTNTKIISKQKMVFSLALLKLPRNSAGFFFKESKTLQSSVIHDLKNSNYLKDGFFLTVT